MKALGFRNKLAARPASDGAAAPLKSDGIGTPAKAIPQWRELRLTPKAALGAVLFVAAVLLCEPDSLIGWLKALAAGFVIPGGAYAAVQVATGTWRVE